MAHTNPLRSMDGRAGSPNPYLPAPHPDGTEHDYMFGGEWLHEEDSDPLDFDPFSGSIGWRIVRIHAPILACSCGARVEGEWEICRHDSMICRCKEVCRC